MLTFSEYSRGNAEKSIEEMFGIPNRIKIEVV
jgi:hypothetical protein